jgi:hypothetical protein
MPGEANLDCCDAATIFFAQSAQICAELRKRKASASEASGEISKLVGKLQGLKRKLQSWQEEGEADMERTNVRLQHLRGHENSSDTSSG